MKNTANSTIPAGFSRETLRWALRELTGWGGPLILTLGKSGWVTRPACLVTSDELSVLDYNGLLAATPDESPEAYTEETFEGLADWVETHAQEWVCEEIDRVAEEVEREEAHQAQIEQRSVNPNATSERLEALRAILANLNRA